MHSLKFDSFNMAVNDCVLDRDLYVFDAKFPSKDLFNRFNSYNSSHCTDQNSFDYSVNDISYHGRFGSLFYDVEYNTRFYMTVSPDKYEYDGISASVLEFNTPNILHNHEKRIFLLADTLYQKGILTDKDIEKLSPYLPYTEGYRMDFSHQVKNLNEYLIARHITMDDIRKKIKQEDCDTF